MRGRVPLRVAALSGVVGLVLLGVGSVVLAKSAYGDIDRFARVELDGSAHAIDLNRTGEYVGYYEQPRLNTSLPAPAVRVSLTGAGGSVPIRDYGSSTKLTYDLRGHHGVAVVTFSITRTGRFVVAGRPETARPGATLAIGRSIAPNAVLGVVLAIVGVVLLLVAVVLLLVGLARRRRHKHESDEWDRSAHSTR